MHRLELIAAGGVDASEARSILAELPRDLDLDGARKLFVAFRAWTWKALDQKRRDPELREWHNIMKRAQVRTKTFDRVVTQLQVLLDLVHESLTVATRRPAAEVLKRRNAKAILVLLRDAPSGQLSKQALMERLDVKHANLSRLMNVLTGAGLVERLSDGREAHFRLSRAGQEQAAGVVMAPPLEVRSCDDVLPVFRSRCVVERRAEELEEQMLALLKDRLQTQRGKKGWLTSFARPDIRAVGDAVRCVQVGAAYYGGEHNLFGDPMEISKVIVVGRSEPDRFSPMLEADRYSFLAGIKPVSVSHG